MNNGRSYILASPSPRPKPTSPHAKAQEILRRLAAEGHIPAEGSENTNPGEWAAMEQTIVRVLSEQ